MFNTLCCLVDMVYSSRAKNHPCGYDMMEKSDGICRGVCFDHIVLKLISKELHGCDVLFYVLCIALSSLLYYYSIQLVLKNCIRIKNRDLMNSLVLYVLLCVMRNRLISNALW